MSTTSPDSFWLLMQDTVSALTVYVTFGFVGIAILFWWRQTLARSGEPPLVPYLIPWVGSAISMGKDPDGFFQNAIERLGPIFRVKAAGVEQVYTTSPSIISAIYRDPETFVFRPIRQEMSVSVFSISSSVTYSDGMLECFDMYHKLLSPKEIPVLVEAYIGLVRDTLRNDLSNWPNKEKKISLKQLILPPAYESAAKAFFGKSFPAGTTFSDFQTFDDVFPLLSIHAPAFATRKGRNAWDRVLSVISDHLNSPEANMCKLFADGDEMFKDLGWSLRDRAAMLGSGLWALNANAVWAVYWILALQLQRPERLAPLVAEIDGSRTAFSSSRDSSSKSLFDDVAGLYDWLSSSASTMPLLSSTIQEALRLCTTSCSIRLVTRDTNLAGYALRKGQKVVTMSRSVHMDDEIHDAPLDFVPTRYVDATKTRTKEGKAVPNHTMPFGGGVSMCEGRHFAQAELRAYVVLLLSMVTIELDEHSTGRPEPDMGRIGLGVMHAKGDIDVIVRPRNL